MHARHAIRPARPPIGSSCLARAFLNPEFLRHPAWRRCPPDLVMCPVGTVTCNVIFAISYLARASSPSSVVSARPWSSPERVPSRTAAASPRQRTPPDAFPWNAPWVPLPVTPPWARASLSHARPPTVTRAHSHLSLHSRCLQRPNLIPLTNAACLTHIVWPPRCISWSRRVAITTRAHFHTGITVSSLEGTIFRLACFLRPWYICSRLSSQRRR